MKTKKAKAQLKLIADFRKLLNTACDPGVKMDEDVLRELALFASSMINFGSDIEQKVDANLDRIRDIRQTKEWKKWDKQKRREQKFKKSLKVGSKVKVVCEHYRASRPYTRVGTILKINGVGYQVGMGDFKIWLNKDLKKRTSTVDYEVVMS